MNVDTEVKESVGIEEGNIAEQLFAEAEKANDGKPLDLETPEEGFKMSGEIGEEKPEEKEAPKAEEAVEGQEPVKKEQEKSLQDKQAAINYMAKAMERARSELKSKTDLTDEQIHNYIGQRFLSAAKKIQKEVESRKKLEGEVGNYRTYHDDMEKQPIIVAIREAMAGGLTQEQLIKRIVGEVAEEQAGEEGPGYAALDKKLTQVLTTLNTSQQKAKTEADQKAHQEAIAKADKQIIEEEGKLAGRYPQFKRWLEEYRSTGILPQEFEEILEQRERDKVTLTYAVNNYFAEKGIPAIIEQTKKDTIKNLQKKSEQKSEASTTVKPAPKSVRHHDEGELAESMVNNALAAQSA